MAQILGYLTSAEAAAFHEQAGLGGIDASALANLLIVRELQLGRLAELTSRFDAEVPTGDRTKITAHQRDDATKLAFGVHAGAKGLKPSPAAAVLFRAELEEHWLLHCLGVNRFDST